MGASVGQRVYWPGSGIVCPDPELLEIGNDVVFGSRSEIYTSDSVNIGKVIIKDGGIVASYVMFLFLTLFSHGSRSCGTTSWRHRWEKDDYGFRRSRKAQYSIQRWLNLDGVW
jgi:hypothetical protein